MSIIDRILGRDKSEVKVAPVSSEKKETRVSYGDISSGNVPSTNDRVVVGGGVKYPSQSSSSPSNRRASSSPQVTESITELPQQQISQPQSQVVSQTPETRISYNQFRDSIGYSSQGGRVSFANEPVRPVSQRINTPQGQVEINPDVIRQLETNRVQRSPISRTANTIFDNYRYAEYQTSQFVQNFARGLPNQLGVSPELQGASLYTLQRIRQDYLGVKGTGIAGVEETLTKYPPLTLGAGSGGEFAKQTAGFVGGGLRFFRDKPLAAAATFGVGGAVGGVSEFAAGSKIATGVINTLGIGGGLVFAGEKAYQIYQTPSKVGSILGESTAEVGTFAAGFKTAPKVISGIKSGVSGIKGMLPSTPKFTGSETPIGFRFGAEAAPKTYFQEEIYLDPYSNQLARPTFDIFKTPRLRSGADIVVARGGGESFDIIERQPRFTSRVRRTPEQEALRQLSLRGLDSGRVNINNQEALRFPEPKPSSKPAAPINFELETPKRTTRIINARDLIGEEPKAPSELTKTSSSRGRSQSQELVLEKPKLEEPKLEESFSTEKRGRGRSITTTDSIQSQAFKSAKPNLLFASGLGLGALSSFGFASGQAQNQSFNFAQPQPQQTKQTFGSSSLIGQGITEALGVGALAATPLFFSFEPFVGAPLKGLPSGVFQSPLGQVRLKKSFKRTPSFAAAQLGITARRPSSLEFTGLFERPLLR